MSNELVSRVRVYEIDHAPDGWPAIPMSEVSALADEIELLQTKLAALEAVPVLDIIGDKDREIFALTAQVETLQAESAELRARVPADGDMVIPAGVAARIVSINIKTGETWADRAVFETVPLADALARAIGGTKCE